MNNKRFDNEELSMMNQAASSIEQAELKLEDAYIKNKAEQFNEIKRFILKLNSKISESLK